MPRQGLGGYLAACEGRYSAEHRMLGGEHHGPGYHTRVPDGAWVHATRESLDYALALLRSGERRRHEQAAGIIGEARHRDRGRARIAAGG